MLVGQGQVLILDVSFVLTLSFDQSKAASAHATQGCHLYWIMLLWLQSYKHLASYGNLINLDELRR